jgi:hypothetical protein
MDSSPDERMRNGRCQYQSSLAWFQDRIGQIEERGSAMAESGCQYKPIGSAERGRS